MFRQWPVQFCSQIRLASKSLKVVQKEHQPLPILLPAGECGKGVVLISSDNSKPIGVRKQ